MTTCEQFTAVAMCPECGAVDVWPWREPRREPKGNDPVDKMQRRFAGYSWLIPGFGFDADDAAVMRQCACGHEWGQR